MRSFLLLLVGLLLAGVGQSASAGVYNWDNLFLTESGDCFVLGERVVRLWTDAGYDAADSTYGHSLMGWRLTSVSGYARAVGDVCSLGAKGRNGVTGVETALNVNYTLSSVSHEDSLDEIGRVPVQSVLVMVGCALMFGIGMVVGKA